MVWPLHPYTTVLFEEVAQQHAAIFGYLEQPMRVAIAINWWCVFFFPSPALYPVFGLGN